MNTKTTVLYALLVPGLLTLAACDRAGSDDAATPPVADTVPAEPAPPPVDTTPDAAAMTGDDLSFAQMDANSDGSVTMDEMSPTDMLHQHFSVADADGDGKLSEAEVTQHRADMAADEPR